MYAPQHYHKEKVTMTVIKLIENEELGLELEAIKLSRPNCSTDAEAAQYAVLNYMAECEAHNETRKLLQLALSELERINNGNNTAISLKPKSH